MGTNYYRIPKHEEVIARREQLIKDVVNLDLDPSNIERFFSVLPVPNSKYDWETQNPWDKFMDGMSVHLGKRSGGWKFCWNFHKNKNYSNKEELLEYIRSGRVVDEYGTEWFVDEFIDMAFSWGEPDGLVINEEYRRAERLNGHGTFWLDSDKYDDLIIDGLRVSSSTEFF